LLDLLV